VLVANVGDSGVAELVARLADWPGRILATALVDASPQRLGSFARGIGERFRSAAGPAETLLGRITTAAPDSTTVEIAGLDPLAGPRPVRLPTAGRHNVMNALGVAGAAASIGLDAAAVVAGLAGFGGVGRRLERKGEAAGVVVYDDYGHHPTAIRETLAAVRQREPGRRVWAVYEPLTYHRTAAMLDRFADVLAEADRAAVIDIWAVRDPDTTITSAAALAEATSERSRVPAVATGSPEATADYLADVVEPGDVVLVMGGGRSYVAAETLVTRLREREPVA
jgi:UDP-N-acetylmuramate--alanine ligase